jgi:hypothetical protein
MENYWVETINLVQPKSGPQLISKPTLKPELLQKVPFKFLHDVITGVRSLGCLVSICTYPWFEDQKCTGIMLP